MPRIEIDELRCKGCGLCTLVCSHKVVVMSDKVNSSGYAPACAPDQTKCSGCALCAEICPDVAIIIFK